MVNPKNENFQMKFLAGVMKLDETAAETIAGLALIQRGGGFGSVPDSEIMQGFNKVGRVIEAQREMIKNISEYLLTVIDQIDGMEELLNSLPEDDSQENPGS